MEKIKKIGSKKLSGIIILIGIFLSSTYLLQSIQNVSIINRLLIIPIYAGMYSLISLVVSIIPAIIYILISKTKKINSDILLRIYAIIFLVLSTTMAPSFYIKNSLITKKSSGPSSPSTSSGLPGR
jgi:hypothetical protein